MKDILDLLHRQGRVELVRLFFCFAEDDNTSRCSSIYCYKVAKGLIYSSAFFTNTQTEMLNCSRCFNFEILDEIDSLAASAHELIG